MDTQCCWDAYVWFGSHLKYRYVCLSNFPFKVFPEAASRACVTIATPIWHSSGCECGCGCWEAARKLFHFHFHSIMWMDGWDGLGASVDVNGWVVISAGSLKCLHSHHRATYKRWAGCIGLWQLDGVNKINQVCIYATSTPPAASLHLCIRASLSESDSESQRLQLQLHLCLFCNVSKEAREGVGKGCLMSIIVLRRAIHFPAEEVEKYILKRACINYEKTEKRLKPRVYIYMVI